METATSTTTIVVELTALFKRIATKIVRNAQVVQIDPLVSYSELMNEAIFFIPDNFSNVERYLRFARTRHLYDDLADEAFEVLKFIITVAWSRGHVATYSKGKCASFQRLDELLMANQLPPVGTDLPSGAIVAPSALRYITAHNKLPYTII